jgi:hypothetical protein
MSGCEGPGFVRHKAPASRSGRNLVHQRISLLIGSYLANQADQIVSNTKKVLRGYSHPGRELGRFSPGAVLRLASNCTVLGSQFGSMSGVALRPRSSCRHNRTAMPLLTDNPIKSDAFDSRHYAVARWIKGSFAPVTERMAASTPYVTKTEDASVLLEPAPLLENRAFKA